MTTVETIFSLFESRGSEAYFGEEVSQLEHALQAAWFAEQDGASETEVIAALLHDVGHLVHGGPENIADQGVDMRHEEAGERWLNGRFPAEVIAPVRLHVDAKRYLCAVNREYAGRLSAASVKSLALQGGPMNDSEVAAFEAQPGFRSAVRVRLWDDRAKVVGLAVPPLEHYRERIERCAFE